MSSQFGKLFSSDPWEELTQYFNGFEYSLRDTFKNTSERLERIKADSRWTGSYPIQERFPVHPLLRSDDFIPYILIFVTTKTIYENIAKEDVIMDSNYFITKAMLLGQLIVFFRPEGVSVNVVCLCPYRVVERGEVRRLFQSAFVHKDLIHLLNNLNSFTASAAVIERANGAGGLLMETMTAMVLSHGLYICEAYVEKTLFDNNNIYYSVGGVGLSSVCLALEVIAGYQGDYWVLVLGIPIPAQFSVWLNLMLTQYFVPEASFRAHLCGIVAGVLRVYVPRAVECAGDLIIGVVNPQSVQERRRRRQYQQQSSNQRGGPPQKRKLAMFVLHVCLGVVSTLTCVALQNRGRKTWGSLRWR